MPRHPEPGFTAAEVIGLAGVTYRQLDYWARNGHLRPSIAEASGSGSQRLYSSWDVTAAKALGRLSALGFRPGSATEALPETLTALLDRLTVELEALSRETEEAALAEDHRRPA